MLKLAEGVLSFFDFGAVLESLKRYREQGLEMDLKEFLKTLLLGKGYENITPVQLSEKMILNPSSFTLIDLREKKSFVQNAIEGAISDPFDDLLRGLFVEDKYSKKRNQEIILICDTGQKSRVAASMMADEGFQKAISVKGGMRRWLRWQRLSSTCAHYCHLKLRMS